MSKNLRNRVLIILGIIIGALACIFPIDKRINLGLDLKGGMHLILQVDTQKLDENAKRDAVPRAIEILRNRIDSLGVGETVLQRQGENQILVQLPGVTDREKALDLIKRVAQLEFRLVNDDPTLLQQALTGNVPEGYELKYVKKESNEPILVEEKVSLRGDTVKDARVDFDTQGFNQPYISLTFNNEGSRIFGELTKNNVNRRLAIIIDGEVISAPNINEPIMGGNAQITGRFTYDEASALSLALRSGALPAPMYIEEERTIGPLLGQDSIRDGITASIVGALLVFIFMFFYYLKAGLVADLALLMNFLLIFGIIGFLNIMMPEAQVTLTLPGIAGIILTLGMAVDANILINERIREELNNGSPMKTAINSGFKRALNAIVDSNITTLVAAFMLFQFGSGPIKGFAVTLSIGLLSSLFTAIFVTKTMFLVLLEKGWIGKLRMLSVFKENSKLDFIRIGYVFIALSVILVIVSISTFINKKEAAYGIDFAGGQVQEYRFDKPLQADEIRQALKMAGVGDAAMQQINEAPENVIIRTAEDSEKQVAQAFEKSFPDNGFELLRIEKVGPVVGKALRKRAVLAIAFALAGILVYVGFRFKHFDFATAGVIALLHDVVVSAGLLLLAGRQIDLLVVTVLLTIAGYSINDTIVIYDRVRENMAAMKRKSLKEIINISLNQTLGRTILTTISTMLVVFALFFKGGEVLNTFALCLIIGFTAGIYSTLFIASTAVLAMQGLSTKK
jgi:SecD/SecF fusion protein